MQDASANTQPAPPTTLPNRARLPYGDAIRVFGTIAVVVGHCSDMVMFNSQHVATFSSDFWANHTVNALCRWAVPLYVMLSGAILLADHQQSSAQFFRKRLARLALPTFFWSFAFMAFAIYYTGWLAGWAAGLADLALGRPYGHLHFLFRIAGLYLLTPMFRGYCHHATRRQLGCTVLFAFTLAMADSAWSAFTRTEASVFARFAPFVGFYLAGYWLRDVRLTSRSLLLAAFGWAVGVATLILGTPWLIRLDWALHPEHTGRLVPFPSIAMWLYDFLSPPRVLIALCTWLLFTHIFSRPWPASTRLRPINTALVPATLGIYMIHPVFREILYLNGIDSAWPAWPIGIWLTPLMVYLASAFSILLILRVPYLRRIAG